MATRLFYPVRSDLALLMIVLAVGLALNVTLFVSWIFFRLIDHLAVRPEADAAVAQGQQVPFGGGAPTGLSHSPAVP
jgi:hypothetical protein